MHLRDTHQWSNEQIAASIHSSPHSVATMLKNAEKRSKVSSSQVSDTSNTDSAGRASNSSDDARGSASLPTDKSNNDASVNEVATGNLEVEISEAPKLPEGKEIEKDYTEAFNENKDVKATGSGGSDTATDPEDKIDLEELAGLLPEGQSAVLKTTLGDPLTSKESDKIRSRFARVIQKRVSWASSYGDIINLFIAMVAPVAKRVFKFMEQGKQQQQPPKPQPTQEQQQQPAKETVINVQDQRQSATANQALHKPDVQTQNAQSQPPTQATQQEDPAARAMREYREKMSKQ